MSDGREGAEKDALNPTENCCVGANSHGKAENGQQREARIAAQYSEAEADVLKDRFDHGKSSLVAERFLGLVHAAEASHRLPVRLCLGHALVQIPVHRHLEVRAQFRCYIVFKMTTAEKRGNAVQELQNFSAHRLALSKHPVDHCGHAVPALHFLPQLLTASGSEGIKLRLAVIFRDTPPGRNPAALLEPQQCRVK